MATDYLLIHGVFFQIQESIGLATKPIEGVVAVLNRRLCDFQFAGVIEFPHHILGRGMGRGFLHDVFGEAELSLVYLTEVRLAFNKKYLLRDYTIRYDFAKQPDGTWTGVYTSARTGEGKARCVLISVDADFFTPPQFSIKREPPPV
jgi:hypothetical protein